MTLFRPDAVATLGRLAEPLSAGAAVALGLWLMLLGGWLLWPLGGLVVVLGLAWAVQALRRLRFRQPARTPGLVEVDEKQIGFLSAETGGFVSMDEMAELRLVRLRGARYWRLKQADGQALLVPVDAEGSDRLFDAFAALPGMDSQALVDALEDRAQPGRESLPVPGESIGPVIWRRPATGRRGGLDLAARSGHL